MSILILGNSAVALSAIKTIRAKDKKAPITVVSKEDVPFYSPVLLRYYLEGKLSRDKLFPLSIEYYKQNHITLMLKSKVQRLTAREKKVFFENESVLEYEKLIIGTGASASFPSLKGLEKKGVFSLRTLKDADRILAHGASRAVIVGAGAVAIGVATALRKRGLEVAIIYRRDMSRIIGGRLDIDFSRELLDILSTNGIPVFLNQDSRYLEIYGETVEGIKGKGLDLKCDMIIHATGVNPNTDFIDREEVLLGDRGEILVDETMKTSADDVYAAGDCVSTINLMTGTREYIPIWPNAIEQGKVAALNVMGIEHHYAGCIKENVIDLFGKCLFVAGEMMGERICQREQDKITSVFAREGKITGCQALGGYKDFGAFIRMIRTRYQFNVNESIERQAYCIPRWRKD